MDRRPTLETRPPVLIDAVVRTLIPPACREHVVGDLWERYRSPWQFVLDAARAIPFVIASQIRRTSTLAGVVAVSSSRRYQVQTLWRWYLMPMVPGMLVITIGATIEAAKKGRQLWPALIMIALMAGLGIVIHLSSQGWARTLRIRIDALGSSAQ